MASLSKQLLEAEVCASFIILLFIDILMLGLVQVTTVYFFFLQVSGIYLCMAHADYNDLMELIEQLLLGKHPTFNTTYKLHKDMYQHVFYSVILFDVLLIQEW